MNYSKCEELQEIIDKKFCGLLYDKQIPAALDFILKVLEFIVIKDKEKGKDYYKWSNIDYCEAKYCQNDDELEIIRKRRLQSPNTGKKNYKKEINKYQDESVKEKRNRKKNEITEKSTIRKSESLMIDLIKDDYNIDKPERDKMEFEKEYDSQKFAKINSEKDKIESKKDIHKDEIIIEKKYPCNNEISAEWLSLNNHENVKNKILINYRNSAKMNYTDKIEVEKDNYKAFTNYQKLQSLMRTVDEELEKTCLNYKKGYSLGINEEIKDYLKTKTQRIKKEKVKHKLKP
ncbi:25820_t:CDS:2 [Dentiscutata erythropus]|uniref:25820_t:CDS:1 n=1 Tax=Dentiscutata erythropus TaxID=1348616 RepID=A0A9N9I810_9GLOM|nr:25820_t:CDS:2 [Dentiscutata erythropus]